MEAVKQKSDSADALLAEFFAQDDLKAWPQTPERCWTVRCLCWTTRFTWLRIIGRWVFPIRFFRRLSAAAKSPMKPAPLSAEAKR